MKKILTMIVLLAALAATVFSAFTLHGRVLSLRAENQARVDEAQSALDTARAAYAAIDPSTDEGMGRQIETENQMIADAQQKTDALVKENGDILRENEELTEEIRSLEEQQDIVYYLTAYESMSNGIKLVEGYINAE